MPGEREPIVDILPRCLPALADKSWQGEQLTRIWRRLRLTDSSARFRTDGDELVIGPADGASIEIEPEAQFREQQKLVSDQPRGPAECRWGHFNRVEKRLERIVNSRTGLTFGNNRRGEHRRLVDRRRRQWFRQQGAATVDQLEGCLGKLSLSSGREPRLDDIAGNQNRPHPTPAGAAHVSGLEPVVEGHQANDCPMLAMIPETTDDRSSFEPHQPPGWK